MVVEFKNGNEEIAKVLSELVDQAGLLLSERDMEHSVECCDGCFQGTACTGEGTCATKVQS